MQSINMARVGHASSVSCGDSSLVKSRPSLKAVERQTPIGGEDQATSALTQGGSKLDSHHALSSSRQLAIPVIPLPKDAASFPLFITPNEQTTEPN